VTPYKKGAAYYVFSGMITTIPSENENTPDIKFIPLETLERNSGKKKVCGFFVNENMIFEADLNGDASDISVGDCLCFYPDTEGENTAVDSAIGFDARLIDKTSTPEGKVLVALKY
jgi:hypothetical protein